jgi:hypothetical protein
MGNNINSYELRGHSFSVRSSKMVKDHHFAFSISLRLPTGRFWVAYYHWLENLTPSRQANLATQGKVESIARGTGVSPTTLKSAAVFPKDVIVNEAKATLHYITKKGDRSVLVRLDIGGKQTLQFRMLEQKPSAENEDLVFEGTIYLWPADSKKGGPRQAICASSFGSAPAEPWRAF